MRMCQIIESTPSLSPSICGTPWRWRSSWPPRSPAARAWTWTTTRGRGVLVAAFSGVMRAAIRSWSGGEDISVSAARQAVESYVDQLGPALSQDWSTGGTGQSHVTSTLLSRAALRTPSSN